MGRHSASSDPSFVRFWFLTIDDNVVMSETYEDTLRVIDNALKDPRGWARKGYQFVAIPPEHGLLLRQDKKRWRDVIHVRLSTNDRVRLECDLDGLSCADLGTNEIYFNAYRWFFGSKESGMDLDTYRVQLVSHEFGHILNRGHYKCRKGIDLCPVMYQQTISKGCCKPNPFPLDWE